MGYNRENFIKIKKEYEYKNLSAKEVALKKCEELYALYPEFEALDKALRETGVKIMREASYGSLGLQERIDKIKIENKELKNYRDTFLKNHGYPLDYTNVKYECKECNDTGFIETKVCSCMKKLLIYEGYKSSGIWNLIKTQNFETFNLSYYKDDKSAFDIMDRTLKKCKQYAESFNTKEPHNLFMIGNTGLGKTHLSSSIAKVIVEKGYDAMYSPVQNVFNDFETEKFGRNYNDPNESITDKYFDCDLLIIDDLGAEMKTQFTISCFYNIVNTRLNKEKSMVISTNYTRDELRKFYDDRITSRLFGEFHIVNFVGGDIRMEKLKKRSVFKDEDDI